MNDKHKTNLEPLIDNRENRRKSGRRSGFKISAKLNKKGDN